MDAGAIAAVVIIIGGAALLLWQNGFAGALLGQLSAQQIAQYAANAGFTGSDLTTATAIALAESGGNPNAYNPETAAGTPNGFGSFGLWQIYLNAHPEFFGQNLYDPQTNADAAFRVFTASGFTAWTTYNTGAYLAQLKAAQEVSA